MFCKIIAIPQAFTSQGCASLFQWHTFPPSSTRACRSLTLAPWHVPLRAKPALRKVSWVFTKHVSSFLRLVYSLHAWITNFFAKRRKRRRTKQVEDIEKPAEACRSRRTTEGPWWRDVRQRKCQTSKERKKIKRKKSLWRRIIQTYLSF